MCYVCSPIKVHLLPCFSYHHHYFATLDFIATFFFLCGYNIYKHYFKGFYSLRMFVVDTNNGLYILYKVTVIYNIIALYYCLYHNVLPLFVI